MTVCLDQALARAQPLRWPADNSVRRVIEHLADHLLAVHESRKPRAARAMPSAESRSLMLVQLLREHVDQLGTAPDRRVFHTYRGAIYLPSTLW